MKKEIEDKLQKSKENQWCIRLKSDFPDKDIFDGIVLHYTKEIVIIHEIRDFIFYGIVALNRKRIKDIRDGKFEKCENEIIRDNNSIQELKKIPWIKNIKDIKELITQIEKKKIWPAVEILDKKISGFYIGPITYISEKDFSLFCYDATGKWEKEYVLSLKKVGKIEIESSYTRIFNEFMKRNNPYTNHENGKT